ncbi:MAG: hypothetical protein JST73_12200 [Actinobacteria bacterium]|nr:hypothetical protein [Actinomycetota bacterium]
MADADRIVEPVHWGAHLVRSPEVSYTEVDGTPVVVRWVDREVEALTPTWAALWGRLDGRGVAEALDVDPGTLDPVTARNLLEVLRRFKADGLVDDAVDGGPTSHTESLAAGASASKPMPTSFTADLVVASGTVTLRLGPTIDGRIQATLDQIDGDPRIRVGRRGRRRTVTDVEVTFDDPTFDDESTAPIRRFVELVRAVDPPDTSDRARLTDLLAGIAERAHAPVPGPH